MKTLLESIEKVASEIKAPQTRTKESAIEKEAALILMELEDMEKQASEIQHDSEGNVVISKSLAVQLGLIEGSSEEVQDQESKDKEEAEDKEDGDDYDDDDVKEALECFEESIKLAASAERAFAEASIMKEASIRVLYKAGQIDEGDIAKLASYQI